MDDAPAALAVEAPAGASIGGVAAWSQSCGGVRLTASPYHAHVQRAPAADDGERSTVTARPHHWIATYNCLPVAIQKLVAVVAGELRTGIDGQSV